MCSDLVVKTGSPSGLLDQSPEEVFSIFGRRKGLIGLLLLSLRTPRPPSISL